MLLLPESPRTSTVAEITRTEKSVFIRFPEKNDAFRDTVKAARYQWDWDARRWQRKLKPTLHGSVRDRAIEIACRLLAARIGVEVADDLHPAILAGAFTPEHTRWITAYGGDGHGWFRLIWQRPDDLYRAAMRLTGARYDSPAIIVPGSAVEEVIDFAERYDFRLTMEADDLAAAQRQRFAAAIRVAAPTLPDSAPVKSHTKPMPMAIPDYVEVDDDLLD